MWDARFLFLKTYNDTHFATFRVKFAAPCVHTLTFIQYSFILGIAETTLVVTCIYRLCVTRSIKRNTCRRQL